MLIPGRKPARPTSAYTIPAAMAKYRIAMRNTSQFKTRIRARRLQTVEQQSAQIVCHPPPDVGPVWPEDMQSCIFEVAHRRVALCVDVTPFFRCRSGWPPDAAPRGDMLPANRQTLQVRWPSVTETSDEPCSGAGSERQANASVAGRFVLVWDA